MTETELVGRCFMVGFGAEGPDPRLTELLGRGELGGVILFARNAADAAGFRDAIAGVRAAAPGRWPLVALDQEGGAVLRVTQGASDLPAAYALGESGDEALVESVGRAAGAELLAMGADVNLAPVLDVNRLRQNPGIGVRSFGTSAARVVRFGSAWLRGLTGSGALGCAKHFPGKGAASLDAHLALPTVPASRSELEAHDLPPFAAAAKAGVPLLMTSHVVYPALDPARCATFSAAAVHLARHDLGFTGVVISDDLEMGALPETGIPPEDRALEAVRAGHDLVLVCHTRDLHLAMRDRMLHEVRRDPGFAARVREAAGRVEALQARAAKATRRPLEELVEAHRPLMARAHRAGVKVARGPARLDPEGAWHVYVPRLEKLTKVEDGTDAASVLLGRLRTHLPRLAVSEFDPVKAEAPDPAPGTRVLFLSYNAHLYPAQAALLVRVGERAGPGRLALAALRNPFDLDLAPGAAPSLAAHGFRRGPQTALADLLTGEAADSA